MGGQLFANTSFMDGQGQLAKGNSHLVVLLVSWAQLWQTNQPLIQMRHRHQDLDGDKHVAVVGGILKACWEAVCGVSWLPALQTYTS